MKSDKINGKWVTLKGGRRVFIEEGETLESALKKSEEEKAEKAKRLYDSDYSGTSDKGGGKIILPKQEYAAVCSAIRTDYTNKIPEKGYIFCGNHYYLFEHNSETNEIVFIKKAEI